MKVNVLEKKPVHFLKRRDDDIEIQFNLFYLLTSNNNNMNYIFQIIIFMLKASIKEHSPEKIYDFLLKNFGPLMVLIRGNDVIINFNSKSHYKKALAQKIILL